MCRLQVLLIFIGTTLCFAKHLKFPDAFKFGISSSAYQIEGAWDVDGKGPSIWDEFTHKHPDRIIDGSNGDIACDSYHHITEDIEMLSHLGVDSYRFSLSWSRILPNGFINSLNPSGVQYYNKLIDELVRNNITPIVTIYHWDLPASLQEIGGWTNPLIVNYFSDYSRLVFKLFGDRVKTWITLNEPYHICQSGFASGIFAPGYKVPNRIGSYMCSYSALLAHANAYHIYHNEFRKTQKGVIGITIDTFWYEPSENNQEHKDLAENVMQMLFGWFAHPIFSKEGDFPPVLKERVLKISLSQNFSKSRLPEFTGSEIEMIKGSSDFFGLNHYSTFLVSPGDGSYSNEFYNVEDVGANIFTNASWEGTAAKWLHIVPWGFRKLLNWIKTEYDNPTVTVTESGCVDGDGKLNDPQRVKYFKLYLEELLSAIHEDQCDVRSYSAWSLMDNFEWNSGYSLKFGLYHVDFNDPNRKRTAKSSAHYYKKVIASRHTSHEYEPVESNGTKLTIQITVFVALLAQLLNIL